MKCKTQMSSELIKYFIVFESRSSMEGQSTICFSEMQIIEK